MPYTAEKLGLLLLLRKQVDSKKKVRATYREGGASAMNNLKRAFTKLYAVYSKSLKSYLETKHTKANKSVRLPSLDCQLTGTLLQYKFPWNLKKKDVSGSPCCQHTSTMAVESNADLNAKNRELRTSASANGGDSKCTATSALDGSKEWTQQSIARGDRTFCLDSAHHDGDPKTQRPGASACQRSLFAQAAPGCVDFVCN